LTKTLFYSTAKYLIFRYKMKRITVKLVGLLVLSSLLAMFPNVITVKAEAATIVVPDDFSTIQEAVEHAKEGDTVFVKNGVYTVDDNTTMVIDKTLSLIGEDPENTVILGAFSTYPENDVAIRVAAPNVTLSGFTIKDCPVAIAVANYYAEPYPSGCRIIGNNIVNNSEAIRPQRNDLLISGNNITGNQAGITGYNAENVVITGNNITDNHYHGVDIGQSRNVTVCRNNISNNAGGLNLIYYGPYNVYGNNITQNGWGIRFAEGCQNATICGNNISQNGVGVVLLNFPNGGDVAVSGVGNTVFGNLFVGNSEQVTKDEIEYENINVTWSMGTDIVLWDNGVLGNYWDDYDGSDKNDDEIGDTPYIIDENNRDNRPSMYPLDVSAIPEFPTWVILPLLAAMLSVILIYRRNMKLSGQMGGSKVNRSFFSGDNSRGS
jgi:nitrous oxidase accessory protein NosD